MVDKTRDFLRIRAAARAQGDWGLERAMTVELERLGYRDSPGSVVFETTEPALFEKAVVEKRRGRPKLPRCEHDRIVGRCVDCDGEDS